MRSEEFIQYMENEDEEDNASLERKFYDHLARVIAKKEKEQTILWEKILGEWN